MKIKWTKQGLAGYQSAGEDLRTKGYRAVREKPDTDVESVWTYWMKNQGNHSVWQQTWYKTGDVVYWGQTEVVE